MKSGKQKFGYKFSNALLSPRLLRHNNFNLLSEDASSGENSRKSVVRTNSSSAVDRKFGSPSLDRAAARLGKMMPRRDSFSTFLAGLKLDKKEDYSSVSSLSLKHEKKDSYENNLKTEPHHLIDDKHYLSSDSFASEESSNSEVFFYPTLNIVHNTDDEDESCLSIEMVKYSLWLAVQLVSILVCLTSVVLVIFILIAAWFLCTA